MAALALVTAVRADVRARDACVPTPIVKSDGPNIFSPRQEMDLGEAIHEQLQSLGVFRLIEDEELASPLARIGERLARHMPSSDLPFRYFLSDMPSVNAVTLPGGRIYVTRKLVASVRSEDELAGVLAHEVGHGLARDGAVRMTRLLRQSLGVNQLGDREDVFRAYHQLLENTQRKPDAHRYERNADEPLQVSADAVSIEALARAGYQPQALADWWDRVTETRGRTGSWLSDLFGLTRPEVKRLRGMLKAQASVPAACIEPRTSSAVGDFERWQAAVVAHRERGRKESVPGVIARKSLDPPLQPAIEHLRFSPDGRFVLAQDDASIFVLSRDPFALRFRVEAAEAAPAQFTPDSAALVFHTPALRVEKWDLASGERVSAQELARVDPCLQAALSPDGRFLACYDSRFRLALIDVETGEHVFEKPSFFVPSLGSLLSQVRRRSGVEDAGSGLIQTAFSPDGRYFVAGAQRTAPVGFDLHARRPVTLPGMFRDLTPLGLAFVGSDRMVGIDAHGGRNSALVRFPSGEVISRLPLRPGYRLAAGSAGDYLLVRPSDGQQVTVMALDTTRAVLANRTPALDVFGDQAVNEVGDGRLDLRRWRRESRSERIASVELPRSPLGVLRAAAVAPDLRWLAVSGRGRGGVWDLERGERVAHVRGFNGAHIDPQGSVVYADFPAFGTEERALVGVDLAGRRVVQGRPLDASSVQLGDLMLRIRHDARDTRRITGLEASDARSGTALWSRDLPAASFAVYWGNAPSHLTLAWPLAEAAARDEIKRNPALRARLPALKKEEGVLLESIDRRTGRTLGAVPVDTGGGSFGIVGVQALGDALAINDSLGRVLLYSLSTGELRARLFGNRPTLAESGRMLSVESAAGRLTVYDVTRLEKRGEFVFSSAVAFAGFSPDGSRLLVLTADQTAFLIATPSIVE